MVYSFAANAVQQLFFLAALFVGIATAAADLSVNRRLQEECVCSPTIYTFKVNIGQTCSTNTIEGRPGVKDTTCTDFDESTPDYLYILEKNRNGQDVQEPPIYYSDVFDEFTYTSYSTQLNPNEPLADQQVVGGIKIVFRSGFRVQEVTWTYDLTNCDAVPISDGAKIGMIEVVKYTPAIPTFCPATNQPTPSPVVGSMSYSASFSLAHMSKASKGKAHKAGKIKSGKLVRERN